MYYLSLFQAVLLNHELKFIFTIIIPIEDILRLHQFGNNNCGWSLLKMNCQEGKLVSECFSPCSRSVCKRVFSFERVNKKIKLLYDLSHT